MLIDCFHLGKRQSTTRMHLIKKGKDLLSQYKHKENHLVQVILSFLIFMINFNLLRFAHIPIDIKTFYSTHMLQHYVTYVLLDELSVRPG